MSAAHPLRQYVIGLYRRGELGTLEEGAIIGGVSRRRVMAWLETSGIDWQAARLRFIAKHRRRAVEQHEGKPAKAAVSKKVLRARAKRAKAQWDRRAR